MKKEKWEVVFDDEDEVITWRYDLSKNKNGPCEVEVKQKSKTKKK